MLLVFILPVTSSISVNPAGSVALPSFLLYRSLLIMYIVADVALICTPCGISYNSYSSMFHEFS